MAIINTGPATGGSSVDEEEEEPTVDSSSSPSSGMYSYETQLKSDIDESVAGQHDGGESLELNQSSENLIKKRSRQIVQSRDEQSDVGPQPDDPAPDQEDADAPDEGIPDPGEYAAAVEERVAALQDAQRQRIGALVTRLRSQSGSGGDGGSGGLSMVIIIVAVLFSLAALAVGLGGDD